MEEVREERTHTHSVPEDEDGPPMLSAEALEALKDFLSDQNRNGEEEEEVALLAEDWRLSQFWYDRHTAETVAKEKIDPNVSLKLLEYDKRFEQYGGEFTFYDYNQPEQLPSSLKNAYQIIVADPPYLSKECLEKVTQTISFLVQPGNVYLLLLTGEVQKDRAAELLGLHPCGFRPQHSSKLGNEFRLFTNYDPGMRLGGWEPDQ
ncbi:hypothetical protein TEA_010295 [Camellia sinensis var. sinensis]|uniref:Protein-lysine N-methyltransferase TEA_010295 n=1 Tax=Camellia sinensis var. sinensis TaxID=542762 RepID=A0A4S4F283_CAMSN|nr:hypothetical protein TEA_010295 [Camellia sinensis var. sinensis]